MHFALTALAFEEEEDEVEVADELAGEGVGVVVLEWVAVVLDFVIGVFDVEVETVGLGYFWMFDVFAAGANDDWVNIDDINELIYDIMLADDNGFDELPVVEAFCVKFGAAGCTCKLFWVFCGLMLFKVLLATLLVAAVLVVEIFVLLMLVILLLLVVELLLVLLTLLFVAFKGTGFTVVPLPLLTLDDDILYWILSVGRDILIDELVEFIPCEVDVEVFVFTNDFIFAFVFVLVIVALGEGSVKVGAADNVWVLSKDGEVEEEGTDDAEGWDRIGEDPDGNVVWLTFFSTLLGELAFRLLTTWLDCPSIPEVMAGADVEVATLLFAKIFVSFCAFIIEEVGDFAVLVAMFIIVLLGFVLLTVIVMVVDDEDVDVDIDEAGEKDAPSILIFVFDDEEEVGGIALFAWDGIGCKVVDCKAAWEIVEGIADVLTAGIEIPVVLFDVVCGGTFAVLVKF